MSWSIARRNLWRSKRRSVVTGLAVALGVAGLSLAAGYVYRVKNYMTAWSIYHNQTGHVSIYKKGGLEQALVRPRSFTLTPSDYAFLQSAANGIGGVERVAGFLHGTGLAGNGCKTIPFSARGLPVDFEKWMRVHPEVLRWTPELAAVKAGVGLASSPVIEGVVAGQGLLSMLSKDPKIFTGGKGPSFVPDCASEDDVQKLRFDANIQLAATGYQGEFGVVDAEVVGSFSSGYSDVDASILTVPLPLLQQLYSTENLTYAAVYLESPSTTEAFRSALAQRAQSAGIAFDTYAYDDKAVAPVLVGTLTFLYTLGAAIALVLCGLASLTILNTMTISVSERTREMGMLRSLGYRRKDLMNLFVKEATLVLLAGACAGVALAYAVAAIVNALDVRFKPPGVADTMQFLIVLSPPVLAVIALVLGALGALATRIACRKKVDTSIATLLQGTGA